MKLFHVSLELKFTSFTYSTRLFGSFKSWQYLKTIKNQSYYFWREKPKINHRLCSIVVVFGLYLKCFVGTYFSTWQLAIESFCIFELRTYRPSGILKQLYTKKMSKYKMTHCYQANNSSSNTSAKIQKANKSTTPAGEAF